MYLGDPGGFLRCEKKDPLVVGFHARHATTRTRSSHAYIYLIENPSVYVDHAAPCQKMWIFVFSGAELQAHYHPYM